MEAKIRKTNGSKRIVSFDVLRAVAVLLVVLCHATEAIYFSAEQPISDFATTTSYVLFTIGRLGVPFFLFLTGALILKKQIDTDEDVLSFYKKNLLPLIVVHLAWVIIYNLFFALNGQYNELTFDAIFKEFFLLKQVPLSNMWYIPMIIGIYICLPFLAKLVKAFSKKSIIIPVLIVFVFVYILPFINIFLRIFGVDDEYLLCSPFDISFLGGIYGVYVLLGYYLTNTKKQKIKSFWLILIALLCFFITCFVQLFSRSDWSHYYYILWYDFPFLLICSACIFMLVNRINFEKHLGKVIFKMINFVSRASLAIFFIHIIVLLVLSPFISGLGVILPFKFLLLLVATFLISAIVCYILSKFRVISRWVLLIK